MKNNDPPVNLDALASQLSTLKPASSHAIQGDVFYRAGFTAAKQETQKERRAQLRMLSVASLLLAFTLGWSGYYLGVQESKSIVLAERSKESESMVTADDHTVVASLDRTLSNTLPAPAWDSSPKPAVTEPEVITYDLVAAESIDSFVPPWVRWAQNRWGQNRGGSDLGVSAMNDQEPLNSLPYLGSDRKVKRRKSPKRNRTLSHPPDWNPIETIPSRFHSPIFGINRLDPLL